MSDGEAQRAMRDAIEDGLYNPCGCNKYRRHHCGIVDPRDAEREAEKKAAAERLSVCRFPNCIRPRASGARECDADDSDRLCVYCRREASGLPRFPPGDPEGCNLVADRERAESEVIFREGYWAGYEEGADLDSSGDVDAAVEAWRAAKGGAT